MSDDIKVERLLERDDLPAFFRELATTLEQEESAGELAGVGNFKKFKLSVRDDFGKLSLKLKVKPAQSPRADGIDAATGEAPGMGDMKPKYSTLKKRMKSSFKLIFKMLHEDQMPPQEAVDSFVVDSKLMCTYPGYGDEYYDEYLAATDEFDQACAAGDLERMKAAVAELAGQKGRCHAKYD